VLGLARIIHEFLGRPEKSKEFRTECLPADGGSIVGSNFRFALCRINNLREVAGEVTETTHRDHGEAPEMFSVHAVVTWFKDTDTLTTL
jgi:hypothetical protein